MEAWATGDLAPNTGEKRRMLKLLTGAGFLTLSFGATSAAYLASGDGPVLQKKPLCDGKGGLALCRQLLLEANRQLPIIEFSLHLALPFICPSFTPLAPHLLFHLISLIGPCLVNLPISLGLKTPVVSSHQMAMCQKPVHPVNIPTPTKMGSEMGGAPTPKWDPQPNGLFARTLPRAVSLPHRGSPSAGAPGHSHPLSGQVALPPGDREVHLCHFSVAFCEALLKVTTF